MPLFIYRLQFSFPYFKTRKSTKVFHSFCFSIFRFINALPSLVYFQKCLCFQMRTIHLNFISILFRKRELFPIYELVFVAVILCVQCYHWMFWIVAFRLLLWTFFSFVDWSMSKRKRFIRIKKIVFRTFCMCVCVIALWNRDNIHLETMVNKQNA